MDPRSNVPRDVLESIRDVLDKGIKLNLKRVMRQELKSEKFENRVLAFSPCRLFIMAAKVPTKLEQTFHYLDIQAVESKKPNQLSLTVENKTYSFVSLEPDSEEVNHMITHIGVSLKHIFPALPLDRLIVKVDVVPPERLRTMVEMMKEVERQEPGPCGGFTIMYACMCDYHQLPYREEVSWDVDTIYLSQASKELCLRDFDHLSSKDLLPIISALEHNSWFTKLNANSVRLSTEAAFEILKVVKRNSVLEELSLSNTGLKADYVQKLSTALLSNSSTQLIRLDLSNNSLDDKGVIHLMGSVCNFPRGLTHLDLSRTGLSGRGVARVGEMLGQSQTLASLTCLGLAENSLRSEDLQGLLSLLAAPNSLTHLDLSGTDCAMDMLMGAMLRGCCQHMSVLKLARTAFTHKKTKEVAVPQAWKQFFSSVVSLSHVDLSSSRLPPEALKELLLGVASNRSLKNLHLDLSSNELGSSGAQVIADCFGEIRNVHSLDISNNGFDLDLRNLLREIGKNRTLKRLAIGRNFFGIKPKHMLKVLDALVQLIQDEESGLEALSLADSRLKTDTCFLINALGSNTSLREVDLSGNHMGDFGARMLAKALQINTHLTTIFWDRNNTTAQGFQDIAEALEKNFTLKKMPMPLNDVSAAIRVAPERTEDATQKMEALLQRNHSPRRFASDQAYRLQQGFLISTTQQMVDRLAVQVQDTINALGTGPTSDLQPDLDTASKVIKDANNSKQLLPSLEQIAMASQSAGNPVEVQISKMAETLRKILQDQTEKNVTDMLSCAQELCPTVLGRETFETELRHGCQERSAVPKDFARLIMDEVATDAYNKLSELNLAVASLISEQVVDEVITRMAAMHKTLTNHLNLKKSGMHRAAADHTEKADGESEKDRQDADEMVLREKPSQGASPKVQLNRKSLMSRKMRPQSVMDIIAAEEDGKKKLDALAENEKDASPPSASSTRASLNLGEAPGESKPLSHPSKDRPRGPKRKPPSRPTMVGNAAEASDDGLDAFFLSKPVARDLVVPPESGDSRPASASTPSKSPSITKKPDKPEEPKDTKKKVFGFGKDKDKDKDKPKKDKEKPISSKISNFFSRKSNPSKAEKVEEAEKTPEPERRSLSTPDPDAEEQQGATAMLKEEPEEETDGGSRKEAEEEAEEKKEEEPKVKKEPEKPKFAGMMPGLGAPFGKDVLAEFRLKQEKRQSQQFPTPGTEGEESNNNSMGNNNNSGSAVDNNAVATKSAAKAPAALKPVPPASSAKPASPKPSSKPSSPKSPAKLPPSANGTEGEAPQPAERPASSEVETAAKPPARAGTVAMGKTPTAPPRALLPPKRATVAAHKATGGTKEEPEGSGTEKERAPSPAIRAKPPPPKKPKPPPKGDRLSTSSVKSESGDSEAAKSARNSVEESGVVYDSQTLRLTVKDKIKRLSREVLDDSDASQSKSKSEESTDSTGSTSDPVQPKEPTPPASPSEEQSEKEAEEQQPDTSEETEEKEEAAEEAAEEKEDEVVEEQEESEATGDAETASQGNRKSAGDEEIMV